MLNVLDRVTLLSILPEQGDYLTLKIVRKLRESLAFEEEEISRLNIQQADGRITWDATADEGKEISIGEKAQDIIVGCLEKLNKEKKLTEQHYILYEQFIGD